MRVADVVYNSVVDGEGLRNVVFFQGCSNGCPGCHNKPLQDPNGGEEHTPEQLLERLKEHFSNKLTLSGGEPLEQNKEELCEFIKLFKKECKDRGVTPNIWIYSGCYFQKLIEDPKNVVILKECDVLVDGPFILNKRQELMYRGSSNQRIIELKRSLKSGRAYVNKELQYCGTSLF